MSTKCKSRASKEWAIHGDAPFQMVLDRQHPSVVSGGSMQISCRLMSARDDSVGGSSWDKAWDTSVPSGLRHQPSCAGSVNPSLSGNASGRRGQSSTRQRRWLKQPLHTADPLRHG